MRWWVVSIQVGGSVAMQARRAALTAQMSRKILGPTPLLLYGCSEGSGDEFEGQSLGKYRMTFSILSKIL